MNRDKELETSKNKLETLGKELQDKKRQLEEMVVQGQNKTELEEKNKEHKKKKTQLKEEDRLPDEKTEQLQEQTDPESSAPIRRSSSKEIIPPSLSEETQAEAPVSMAKDDTK
ncbi:calponin homology domain-containing protein DDB_G0272472-like isoform X3, partial [Clarias magur]